MQNRIIIFGDDPTGPTGFGKIVWHLSAAALTAGFKPIVVGLKQQYDTPVSHTKIINAAANNDPHGHDTLSALLEAEKTELVISIGDPWDIQGLVQVKQQHPFTWIGYTPVDATPYPRYVLLTKNPHQYLDVAFLMQQMDHIVAYSTFGQAAIREMLVRAGGSQPAASDIGMIYLGVDPNRFTPQTKAVSRSVFQGIVSKDNLLFSCMKVNSIRAGFDSLFAAWAAYLDKMGRMAPALGQQSRLYLHTAVEDGGYPLTLLMQRYGLENSILLNPSIKPGECFPEEGIAAIHNASDIVVSSARGEGFGLNILEALSCKVPCIVPDYGCPAEYGGEAVRRVPIAATFNPEFATTDFAIVDVPRMADRMVELAMDPEKRRRMGNAGRKIAKTLTWDLFVEKWAATIADVVRKKRT